MKAKHVVLVLAATGLMSSQVLAAEAGIDGAASAQALEVFTEADASSLFEQSGKPMQVATLSAAEMEDTEGALLPILGVAALGAAVGGIGSAAIHAVTNHAQGLPVTQQGLRIAAASGALTGAVGGPLVGAAGGGIAGNVAWRPGLVALNNGMQRAANGVMGNQ